MFLKLLFFCSYLVLTLGDEYHPRFKSNKPTKNTGEGVDFWKNAGQDELANALNIRNNLIEKKAKNVIIFVGDGMSLPTLTAARIYKAQKAQNFDGSVNGEESTLFFEQFPHVGLSKTYSVDHQTPDSAATATALFTGVKTDSGTLGYDEMIEPENADSIKEATALNSILHYAQKAGKDTGLVTTTRVTHATPASLYAHSADRDWECYRHLEKVGVQDKVEDIAYQLMNNEPGTKMKVILGGGRQTMLPKKEDPETLNIDDDYSNEYTYHCYTNDRDFIEEFKSSAKGNFYVSNKTELDNIDVDQTDRLLGLFSETHVIFDHERRENLVDIVPDAPSLVDMTTKAIEMLKKNTENGFFLMVESGRIDHAHHDSWVNLALDETVVFDEAIKAAYDMVDLDETLIIVTADHGHTMSHAGYPTRGSDVRMYADNIDDETGDDHNGYAILSYANGEGFDIHNMAYNGTHATRTNMTGLTANMTDMYFVAPATAPKSYESHSASDVGIFAQGPFAHLFHGLHEQSYIYTVMTYAACLDQFEKESHCGDTENSAFVLKLNPALFLFMTLKMVL